VGRTAKWSWACPEPVSLALVTLAALIVTIVITRQDGQHAD
jgi:hypothetical protein